jgi:hypothetical protein
MTLPPLQIVLAMNAVASGLLWVIVRILAPTGFEFSILRVLGAVITINILGNGSRHFLSPLIGDWYMVVEILALILAVKAVLKLAFWRCVLVALTYFMVVSIVNYFVFSSWMG